ncbi:hydroxymethylglutaryl-CoA lyase [Dyadobacter frigoris]|uniref:Hydroxymethylglutaryl-CoA lyase n=1 Tax=Dyadobacter frigoris TaxID=2576211 RepID=A0A4U6CXL6_9BACT|nr:hydroxymethylglutaryl-CoA lyase [Dyadobacter frigoris]TKT89600.1 hydroxymethylglutaryl-CoA lyase [Dyadobacter frigoris]GLU54184.1 hydroxymethylglutaryl-CoA lyase [Dyadobacter frigoris]
MKIIECPRDAWQGHHPFISTNQKIEYLNTLLRVGFDTIDFGSFVSAKAMPQVSDTAEIVSRLNLSNSSTKLLAIIANERGASEACAFNEISYLGYPFSISETFQLRNTNATILESLNRVQEIQKLCQQKNKKLVIYISMGFGNPYGDLWNPEIVLHWVEKLSSLGITIFSLADTVGLASVDAISSLFSQLIPANQDLEFGAHFHSKPEEWKTKIDAAYNAGCRRFDGALLGYGGCPMAQDDLVGNMPTERLLDFIIEKKETNLLDLNALDEAKEMFLRLIR